MAKGRAIAVVGGGFLIACYAMKMDIDEKDQEIAALAGAHALDRESVEQEVSEMMTDYEGQKATAGKRLAAAKESKEEAEKKLAAVQRKNQLLQGQVNGLMERRATADSHMEMMQETMAKEDGEIDSIKQEIAVLEAKITRLQRAGISVPGR